MYHYVENTFYQIVSNKNENKIHNICERFNHLNEKIFLSVDAITAIIFLQVFATFLHTNTPYHLSTEDDLQPSKTWLSKILGVNSGKIDVGTESHSNRLADNKAVFELQSW